MFYQKTFNSSLISIDVQNAFQLESPKRQWICATDREEEKNKLMSALCSAINAAITQN